MKISVGRKFRFRFRNFKLQFPFPVFKLWKCTFHLILMKMLSRLNFCRLNKNRIFLQFKFLSWIFNVEGCTGRSRAIWCSTTSNRCLCLPKSPSLKTSLEIPNRTKKSRSEEASTSSKQCRCSLFPQLKLFIICFKLYVIPNQAART